MSSPQISGSSSSRKRSRPGIGVFMFLVLGAYIAVSAAWGGWVSNIWPAVCVFLAFFCGRVSR